MSKGLTEDHLVLNAVMTTGVRFNDAELLKLQT